MRCIVASVVLGSGLQGWTRAVVRAAEPATEPRLEIQIRRTRLDNGLRVVLSRDIARPTVAICLMFAAGARDEARGQRGLSRLLERFLGRAGPRGEAAELDAIAANGGSSRAQTMADRTEFHALLPSNALALGLAMTAGRLHLALTPERFEAERAALLDELRAGSRARAYESGLRKLRSLVFADSQPDENAMDAELGDLAHVTIESARSFLAGYYAPNNAVLSVAGNFEVVEALKLIRRHFGQARRAEGPAAAASNLAEQKQPRLASLRDTLARTAGTFSGWAIPPPETPEHRALDLAATILARGESSRLHQLLVLQESLAREVEAWTDGARGLDLFGLRVILDEGSDAGRVRRLWTAQIGALGRWGPTTGELDRAKHQVRAAFLRDLDGNLARSRRLASFELLRGDAKEITLELARYAAVTREELQRAVGRYLVSARESRVTITPDDAAGALTRYPASQTSTWRYRERQTFGAP